VPDHLICHLKRFDFDLQTMHRSKINDRFEFPTVLDLKPYTLGHLSGAEPDSNGGSKSDEFELVGVLVHTGTAESGHYYSYIRDRLSPGKMPIWFEFNDSEVSVFDHSTIAENCYGGSDGLSADGYSLPKSFSAYMLFYQRSSSLQAMRKLGTAPSDLSESPISTDIRLEIFRENEELVKRHSMFASDYISFVEQLIITYDEAFPSTQTAPDGQGEIDVLLLGLRAFEQICTRVKDFPVTDALATAIERFISRNAECCRIFLEWASNEENISSLIVGNPFATVRSTFARLLIRSVYRMRGSDERLYGIADDDDEALPRRDTMLFKIFRGLCEAWNALQWTFKPWGDFFGFLVEVASWGPDEQECMLSAGILKRLLEMFLIDHISPSDRTERGIEHFAKALSKPRVPATKPVELLCLLMERCSPFVRPTKNEAMRDRYLDLAPLPLTVAEGYYFKMMDRSHGLALFTKLIELPGALPAVIKLIRHLISSDSSPEEHEFLDRLVTTLLSGISIDPAAHADPYLHCLHVFVAATKSQRYVNEIVRKVAMEIPTIGISGGCEHLRFFKGICLLDGPDRNTRSSLLENIGDWAPALIVYCDGGVREETEEFLDELIFEESASFYPEVQQATMNLASGCFDFVVNKFPGNRQSVDESTFGNVLRVLARCKDAEQDPETFETKLEGD
jgi:ubiquitin carboxyl-terminal hydrolase 34